jgi:hypothetical protein
LTLGNASRVTAAKIALKCFAGSVLLNHTVRAGGYTVTASITFPGIDNDDVSFIFKNSFFGAGIQTIRLGALKANAGHRIALKGKIIDFNTRHGGPEHALFYRRTGICATIAAGAAIGDGQQVFLHEYLHF